MTFDPFVILPFLLLLIIVGTAMAVLLKKEDKSKDAGNRDLKE